MGTVLSFIDIDPNYDLGRSARLTRGMSLVSWGSHRVVYCRQQPLIMVRYRDCRFCIRHMM